MNSLFERDNTITTTDDKTDNYVQLPTETDIYCKIMTGLSIQVERRHQDGGGGGLDISKYYDKPCIYLVDITYSDEVLKRSSYASWNEMDGDNRLCRRFEKLGHTLNLRNIIYQFLSNPAICDFKFKDIFILPTEEEDFPNCIKMNGVNGIKIVENMKNMENMENIQIVDLTDEKII